MIRTSLGGERHSPENTERVPHRSQSGNRSASWRETSVAARWIRRKSTLLRGRGGVELMRSRKVSLEESIEALARKTGASPSFVEKVRALFLGRGVDLEDSAEPYVPALEEAFRRHARMRSRLEEARETL